MIIIIMYPLPFYVAGVLKTGVQINSAKYYLQTGLKTEKIHRRKVYRQIKEGERYEEKRWI